MIENDRTGDRIEFLYRSDAELTWEAYWHCRDAEPPLPLDPSTANPDLTGRDLVPRVDVVIEQLAANVNDTWGELDRVPFDSLCRR